MKRFWNNSVCKAFSVVVFGAASVVSGASADAHGFSGGMASGHSSHSSNYTPTNRVNNVQATNFKNQGSNFKNLQATNFKQQNVTNHVANRTIGHSSMMNHFKQNSSSNQFSNLKMNNKNSGIVKNGSKITPVSHMKPNQSMNSFCKPYPGSKHCGSNWSGGCWPYPGNGGCWPYPGGCGWNGGLWSVGLGLPFFGGCYGSDCGYGGYDGGYGGGYGDDGPVTVDVPVNVSVEQAAAAPLPPAPVQVADQGIAPTVDLELASVQLIEAMDAPADQGPTYRVTVRNNSEVPAPAFDVALVATNGENPDQKSPFGVQRVEKIDAGQTVTVDVMLPAKAKELHRTAAGQVEPFTTLFAGVDSRGEIKETTKENNVIRVARLEVPTVATTSASE